MKAGFRGKFNKEKLPEVFLSLLNAGVTNLKAGVT
jgi:hypothetical protein